MTILWEDDGSMFIQQYNNKFEIAFFDEMGHYKDGFFFTINPTTMEIENIHK